jgi:hypothetical protein
VTRGNYGVKKSAIKIVNCCATPFRGAHFSHRRFPYRCRVYRVGVHTLDLIQVGAVVFQNKNNGQTFDVVPIAGGLNWVVRSRLLHTLYRVQRQMDLESFGSLVVNHRMLTK